MHMHKTHTVVYVAGGAVFGCGTVDMAVSSCNRSMV